MDFSEYLLQYAGRFHTKETDLINIILGLAAMFMAVFAIVLTLTSSIQDVTTKILFELSPVILVLGGMFGIKKIGKKWNKTVYQIEQDIMENYDNINNKNSENKKAILMELKRVFSGKPVDTETQTLKKLLSDTDSRS